MQAAGYAAENARPAANAAASTVQANVRPQIRHLPSERDLPELTLTPHKQAPAALGGGTSTTAANTASARDVAPEVPGPVRSSIAEAGEAPEAAASRRAVQGKGQVEGELLGHAAEVDAQDEAGRAQPQQKLPGPPPPGVLPRLDSGPQTPSTGVAVVLGTDTERSFPLGSHPVHVGGEESEPPQASSGGGGGGSAARRPPPAEDKVPVRAAEEQAVGNGPGAYKTLSSGTPSGVGE